MQGLSVMLAPGTVGHIANIVKGYAIAVGVAFAIYMVWQWWRTRLEEARIERTARARSVWARALAQGLAHPELADPTLGAGDGPLDRARYRAFVAGELAAADEILALDPSDQWRATLVRHLTPHQAYFSQPEFRETAFGDCSDEVRGLIDRISAGR